MRRESGVSSPIVRTITEKLRFVDGGYEDLAHSCAVKDELKEGGYLEPVLAKLLERYPASCAEQVKHSLLIAADLRKESPQARVTIADAETLLDGLQIAGLLRKKY